MILTLQELRNISDFEQLSDNELIFLQNAVESYIRKYTNNNFQVRSFRYSSPSINGKLIFTSELFNIGETIQISESEFNNGLYVIQLIDAVDGITVDKELLNEPHNLVTKIIYPDDIKMGAINLMKYEVTGREKASIKSETLSRHSVTYFDTNEENKTIDGYPTSLIGFLKQYKKARF